MDHPAIMTCLMIRQLLLFFNQEDLEVRMSTLKLVHRCGSNDTASDDDKICYSFQGNNFDAKVTNNGYLLVFTNHYLADS